MAEESSYDKQIRAMGSWIDKPFLEEVLENYEKHAVKVIDINIRAAVGAGDNYLSTLYRTTVEYCQEDEEEIKELHIMIKGEAAADMVIQIVETIGVFNKEILIYNKILPAMYVELLKYFPEGVDFIAAKAFPCKRHNTIVMEDLAESGYKMASRQEQLDFDHAAETLKSLARFHALSVKVYEKNPEIFADLSTMEYYKEENRPLLAAFLEGCFPILAREMEKWGEYVRYAPLIENTAEFGWDKIMHLTRESPYLNVLNHGDLWTNNILFRYDADGKVVHAKLIDFQLARISSPSLDILYLLSSSVKPDVLSRRMFELVAIYHESLSSDLQMLELDPSRCTLKMLHEDLKDRSLYVVMVMAQFLPMIVAKPTEAVDLNSYDSNPDADKNDQHPLAHTYLYEGFRDVMCKLLDHWDNVGYLQEIQIRYTPLVEKWRLEQKEKEESAQVSQDNEASDLEIKMNNPSDDSYAIPTKNLAQGHSATSVNSGMFSTFWKSVTRVFVNPPCM